MHRRLTLAAFVAVFSAAFWSAGDALSHRYQWASGSATAYHRCDGSTSLQANGTRIHYGEVANNSLPLGTWVEVMGPRSALKLLGRRYFRVEDRGGPGFLLDFVARNCGWTWRWGRRDVSMRVIPKHHLRSPGGGAARPDHGWFWRCCWERPRWKP